MKNGGVLVQELLLIFCFALLPSDTVASELPRDADPLEILFFTIPLETSFEDAVRRAERFSVSFHEFVYIFGAFRAIWSSQNVLAPGEKNKVQSVLILGVQDNKILCLHYRFSAEYYAAEKTRATERCPVSSAIMPR